MLTPAFVNIISFFYPIGNTPAVSLTQSIPPDASADILLLGCGDVRNILFTNHINSRKMDITCCDNQKAVIARNILLLSLIIDDDAGQNDNSLWGIYYHMYLDEKALDLLRSQAKKLLELSTTMETWQQSKYGSVLSFCDSATLADVRKMWEFYGMDRKGAELFRFNRLFESVLDGAKAQKSYLRRSVNFRSAIPAQLYALDDIFNLDGHYWMYGSTELNATIRASQKHPNPTFLAGEDGATLHHGTNPLQGFHLALAHAPLHRNDAAFDQIDRLPGPERTVAVACLEFREWMASYRKRAAQLRIRFFTGDALSLAHTLQRRRVAASSTAHWYRDRYGFQSLELDGPDYKSSVAPLDFDVIDTSNLCDHLGSLTLLTATSPLLRNHASSVLYTEVLVKRHSTYREVLDDMLCGDVPSVSTLLDLFPVEYWTNTSSNSAAGDELVYIRSVRAGAKLYGDRLAAKGGQMFLRTSWKRPICVIPSTKSCPRPTIIQFDANRLAKVVYQVCAYMFRDEDVATAIANIDFDDPKLSWLLWYNQASFASFLRLVQTRVACDWDEAMGILIDLITEKLETPMRIRYWRELCTYLHMMDVFSIDILQNWHIHKQWQWGFTPSRIRPLNGKWGDLRDWKDIPSVVCVTLKIPRSKLAVFTNINRHRIGTPYVYCRVQSAHTGAWPHMFMACQLAFGDISTSGTPYDDSFEVAVAEDDAGWSGSSALIAAFYVPAFHLLWKPQDVTVAFGIHSSPASIGLFCSELGLILNVYGTTLDNSDGVYVTRYGPGQTRFPIATGFSQMKSVSPTSKADASLIAGVDRETGRIVSFTGRLDIVADSHKQALKDGCEVQKSAASPCEATIRPGGAEPLSLSFPVFIMEASQRMRIARKSAYIEVIARVAGSSGWTDYPQYMYPISFQDGKPINWNMPYLELQTCPVVDIDQRAKLVWLKSHLSLILSAREKHDALAITRNGDVIQAPELPRSVGEQTRLDFKQSLFSLFAQFCGLQGTRHRVFGLGHPSNGGVHILILASNLRLSLADRAVVLDCAILPLHRAAMAELKPFLAIPSAFPTGVMFFRATDAQLQLWRHALAAYVERCRTWHHREDCDYAKSGVIPLRTENDRQFLCTCGNGDFPPDFMANSPFWKDIAKYAVRAAISPAFWAPFADDVSFPPPDWAVSLSTDDWHFGNGCANCGRDKQEDGGNLLKCGRCMEVKYCSRDCQRADWSDHKVFCQE